VASLEEVGAALLSEMAGALRGSAVGLPLRARDGTIRAFAMVDADDYPVVSRWRWSLDANGYVVRRFKRGEPNIRLHRELMGVPPHDKRQVDHRNHDRLNNTRRNLRVVTASGNQQNRRGANRGSSSLHRGVSWNKLSEKWEAYGSVSGRRTHLGYFEDEQEAAEAARQWRADNMPYTRN
jgi:HNH endonuclease